MARNLQPGENPFRERNPANAIKRKEFINPKDKRLIAIEQYMNQRYARLQAERQAERDGI